MEIKKFYINICKTVKYQRDFCREFCTKSRVKMNEYEIISYSHTLTHCLMKSLFYGRMNL